MKLDVRNMTQQQIADANNQWLAQNSQPFTGQPKRPMQSDMGAVGGMPLMPMLPMGVPPMGVPPMGFGPSVNNFGATPGIGNPMQDAFQQFLSAQGQGGIGTPPISQLMDRQRQPGQRLSPEAQAYYDKDRADQIERSQRYERMLAMQGAGGTPPMTQPPMGVPSVGFAGGGTGMPFIGQPMGGGRQYGQSSYADPRPDTRPDPFKPLIQLGPGMPSAGGTGMPPIGQPMTQPPAGGTPPMTQPPMGGLSYNDGFYNPPSAPRQPLTQPPAPMAMKKGGFAVKAVWDRKRPKDLGKPKDLSAKKEKSAKARAKAAGRPYPNLIDNMAVARKKGK